MSQSLRSFRFYPNNPGEKKSNRYIVSVDSRALEGGGRLSNWVNRRPVPLEVT
jgi:hypothetical protein